MILFKRQLHSIATHDWKQSLLCIRIATFKQTKVIIAGLIAAKISLALLSSSFAGKRLVWHVTRSQGISKPNKTTTPPISLHYLIAPDQQPCCGKRAGMIIWRKNSPSDLGAGIKTSRFSTFVATPPPIPPVNPCRRVITSSPGQLA